MNALASESLLALEKESYLLFDKLDNKSDFDCVVEGANFLNRSLEMLLKNFFIEEATVKYLLDPGRALGNYPSRAAAAYCMGLLPKTLYYNLQKICQIYNFFLASKHPTIDFADEHVREMVSHLVLPKSQKAGSTKLLNQYAQLRRRKFIFIVVVTSHEIIATALETEHRPRLSEMW